MKKRSKYLLIPLFVMLALSCSDGNKQFTLLSHKRTGITFRNTIKETEDFNHLHYSYLYNGAGVAIGDINNDGLSDIYFPGNLASSRLYLNKGNFSFEDISKQAGVAAKETWNNGAVFVDIDGDGFLDIYSCSSTDGRTRYRRNLLFMNNGDLTFTEKAAEFGIDDPAYSTHSTFFDYDKDGDLDLFVLNHSLDRYTRFNERSPGYKDEYNSSYGHKLFRNDGHTFSDVTKEAGILSNVINFGLGIAVSDFNNDNWPDIYVCNDYYEQDYFYINQKDGTFSEQLEKWFGHISFSSMGNDAADINNDGHIDLFTLDMLPEENVEQKLVAGPHNYEKFKLLETRGFYNQTTRNMLQLNNYGEFFTEMGQYAGIYSTNWSWSPLICDYDNDGHKDIFISNGYGKNNIHMDVLMMIIEDMQTHQKGGDGMSDMEVIDQVPATILKNYMFRNNGDLTFADVNSEWGFDLSTLSNGTAYADLDNDGDMDLVLNNINDYAFIYRNNSEKRNDNHYLKIELSGSGKNRGGIGARVDMICGEKRYTQEFYPSRGYMSSMDQNLIFGLGEASQVDTLTITWPDFRVQTLQNIPADQTITLNNKDAIPVDKEPESEYETLFKTLDHIKPLHYRHQENDYIDFVNQPLLPYLLSTQGPYTTAGDINSDGREDLFVGGASGYPGVLYFQLENGTFKPKVMECFEADRGSEDLGVLFFDVEGDKDLDLYVVSGGNEFSIYSDKLQDRLYINDGRGNYSKSKNRLPDMVTSGSCVSTADFDSDGDMDLFIGGRLTPGQYPVAPRSYVLKNDGKGYFSDVTEKMSKDLLNPGMVTDALWTDFSGDGLADLILVGEWMPIRLFQNRGSNLEEITGQNWMKDSKGWWNRIFPGDFDHDGDLDYVAGNFGLNSEIKASLNEPVSLYSQDFDNNGLVDPILCFYINGENYPIYSKHELASQIEEIDVMYPDFKSYADQTIFDIFPEEKLKEGDVLTATNFSSSYLENKGNNHFELSQLPLAAQLSPLYGIETGDFNNDGFLDMILAGNFFGTRIRFGRYDANKGLVLLGDGYGHFTEVPNNRSGLFINGEVRDITRVQLSSGSEILLFSTNNDSLQIYQKSKLQDLH